MPDTAETRVGNPLGAFLRARRDSLRPDGGPLSTRRRAPGLRRDEVAQIAGVSVEYLTRLERGNDRRPSPAVVGALARALRLTPAEHVHLHRLVKTVAGDVACGNAAEPTVSAAVMTSIRSILDRLAEVPAQVITPLGSLLASSRGFEVLANRAGIPLDGNLPRYVFTDDRAQRTFSDWSAVADEWAVRLRSRMDLGDPQAAALLGDLASASPDRLSEAYTRSQLPRWHGQETWFDTSLAYTALEIPDSAECRLVIFTEAGARSGNAP